MDIGTAGRILKTVVNFLEGLNHEKLCEDCVEEKNSLFRRVEKFLKLCENEIDKGAPENTKTDQVNDAVGVDR